MLDGFIKCAAATPNVRVADCEYNKNDIISLIEAADKEQVRVLIFPELCITAYTCGDLFHQQTLLDGAMSALKDITCATKGIDMLVAVGCPVRFEGRLYNCAVVIKSGKVLGAVPKKHLPNSNEFYELRNFAPAFEALREIELFGEKVPFGLDLLFKCRQLPEFVFGVEICEDLWAVAPPSNTLALGGATVIGNLSASNEAVGKAEYRRELVRMQSAKTLCGYIFASCGEGESTGDLVFGGHDIIAENGNILNESGAFSSGLTISEIDVQALSLDRSKDTDFVAEKSMNFVEFDMQPTVTELSRYVAKNPFIPDDCDIEKRCRDILAIQAHALARRLSHTWAKTLIIGISGGLDSTLALLVAVETMKLLDRPMSDIITVTMPCFGTTARTRSNAEKLCEMLGTTFRTIDIMAAVKQHFSDIGHDENDHNVVYENAQARERTQILMDLANAENGLVVGTGDLSELALGWATYNGDHMSMYGVNGSVPKTLVRRIVSCYAESCGNEELKNTLISVVDTPVSPELLPADENGDIAQKTEDLVGPYELHDFFLCHIVRHAFAPKKVYRLAKYAFKGEFDNETILKWLKTFCRRFFNQQFKRSCLPDGVKVGSVSLSPRGDWKMPSDAFSTLWLKELDEITE